jgi:hypothetical protein
MLAGGSLIIYTVVVSCFVEWRSRVRISARRRLYWLSLVRGFSQSRCTLSSDKLLHSGGSPVWSLGAVYHLKYRNIILKILTEILPYFMHVDSMYTHKYTWITNGMMNHSQNMFRIQRFRFSQNSKKKKHFLFQPVPLSLYYPVNEKVLRLTQWRGKEGGSKEKACETGRTSLGRYLS